MLFNSLEYFLFLAAVVLIYFLLPFRWRNPFLLIASYYFYMCWKWEFGLLLLSISLINYFAALKMQKSNQPRTRRFWFYLALVASLGALAYFKYFNFFVHEATEFLRSVGIVVEQQYLKIILPVGISFFTFQVLSYTIDVYRGTLECERNIVDFLLFGSFFPTLIAGPISRASNLLKQLKSEQHFSSEQLIMGSKIIIKGLFKKVVIADRLAVYVNQIYSNPHSYEGITLLLASLFFMFQIYADFSGYSDIAVGSANFIGIKLVQNFKLPYLASSISEFWKRWHISLTSWFRDYVFLPVSSLIAVTFKGERFFYIRIEILIYILASMTTWLLTGLWHGANNTFVIWGLLQGLLLIGYHLIRNSLNKIYKKLGIRQNSITVAIVGTILTLITVLFSWVFFRASNIHDAFYIISHIFSGWNRFPYLGSSAFDTTLGFALIMILYIIEFLKYQGFYTVLSRSPKIALGFRYVGYASLLIMIALLGKSTHQFIYFQF